MIRGGYIAEVAVVFHSPGGTTAALAKSILHGVNSVDGVDSRLIEIVGEDIIDGRYENALVFEQLTQADAIIFGAPTFMGSVSAQFKAFADASSEHWSNNAWVNKLAAGFTIGGQYSGDQLSTIQYLQILAGQHGMLWAGLDYRGNQQLEYPYNRLGAHNGLIAKAVKGEAKAVKGEAKAVKSKVHADDLITAAELGKRIAHLAYQLSAVSHCETVKSTPLRLHS